MKRPGNLRISSYISNFPLPGERFVCSVHGYSGAVDIFHNTLAEALEKGDFQACLKTSEVEQMLTQRGYLTTRTAAEETQFISQVNELYWNKQPFVTEFALTFKRPSATAENRLKAPGFIDNLLLALNELRGINAGCLLEMDLRELDADQLEVIEQLFSLAKNWDFNIHLMISDAQLQELAKFIRQELVLKLSVFIAQPDALWSRPRSAEQAMDYPFDCLLEIIDKEVQVECFINADDASDETLGDFLSHLQRLRQRIQTANDAQLILIPLTSQNGNRQARMLEVWAGVIPLREDELADFRQLETHMWSKRMVRFRPCFAVSNRRYEAFSSGEIDLVTDFGRNRKAIGQVFADHYELASTDDEPAPSKHALQDLPQECLTCRLSLLCGGNCNVWDASIGEHFKQKAARLLTIPFLNQL
ncbi:MAG: hypothetical protein HY231_21255 [Acidobacteria bacterium]|nr:hypothetical protein [Acidobacteriota bacterium]